MGDRAMEEKPTSCGCICHKFTGISVVALGLIFLASNLGWISEGLHVWWPVFLILPGVKMMMGKGKCKCCKDA